ncbi:transmembrane 220 family protein [Leptospira sp. 96542]|nr:transmembrane 220 family protein [Leptospira sp. 96542]
MKQTLFKILNGLFAALFLLSASLQYNDPDPIHWMFLYGLGALISLLSIGNRFYLPLFFFMLGVLALQILIIVDGAYIWYTKGMENILSTPMSDDKPYIEEVREFFGSLIVLFAVGLNYYYFRNKVSKD